MKQYYYPEINFLYQEEADVIRTSPVVLGGAYNGDNAIDIDLDSLL